MRPRDERTCSRIFERHSEPIGNQELFHAPQDPYNFPVDEGLAERRNRRNGPLGMLVLLLGLVAIAGVVVITLTQKQFLNPRTSSPSSDSDDMGAGIAQASGLRGHLVTRWQQGKTQYMLKMEPLDRGTPLDSPPSPQISPSPSPSTSVCWTQPGSRYVASRFCCTAARSRRHRPVQTSFRTFRATTARWKRCGRRETCLVRPINIRNSTTGICRPTSQRLRSRMSCLEESQR